LSRFTKLARDGICKRVYGGAVSHLKQSASFETIMTQSVAEKSSVAKRCAKLIKANTCILIVGYPDYLS